MEFNIYRTKKYIEYIKNYFLSPMASAAIFDMYNTKNSNIYKYKHFYKEKLDTAYCFNTKDTFHIVIGRLDGFINIQDSKDRLHITKSLLFHELGHALFTTTNDDKLKKYLKEKEVTHDFWNQAEDIRINELVRKKILNESGNIFWLDLDKYIKLPSIGINSHPENLLLYISLTEHRQEIPHPLYDKVLKYYEDMVNAKDSFEIVEICNKWNNEFDKLYKNKSTERMEELKGEFASNCEDSGSEEGIAEQKNDNRPAVGSLSSLLFEDANPDKDIKALEDALQGNDVQGADPSELGKKEQAMGQSKNEWAKIAQQTKNIQMKNKVPEESNTDTLFDPNLANLNNIDFAELAKTEEALRKIKSKDEDLIATKKPSKRINSKRIASYPINPDKTKIFLKKHQGKTFSFNKIKWKVYLDLSGSMAGEPLSFQKTFLLALNKIAKKFKGANISVVASCSGKEKGNKISIQTIMLPYNEKALSGIETYGGDGMLRALIDSEKKSKNPKNSLLTKDAVIFITDGYFADGYLSKEKIKKFNPKVRTLCLYVGRKENFSENNSSIFDYSIQNENILEAIKELVKVSQKKDLPKPEQILSSCTVTSCR